MVLAETVRMTQNTDKHPDEIGALEVDIRAALSSCCSADACRALLQLQLQLQPSLRALATRWPRQARALELDKAVADARAEVRHAAPRARRAGSANGAPPARQPEVAG